MKYLKLYENFKKGISFKEWIKTGHFATISGIFSKIGSMGQLKISDFDLSEITEFSCSSENLKDLVGVEIFPNLRALWCNHNFLQNLKGLEKLINLETLVCNNNSIVDLIPIENLNLKNLNCTNNKLKKLENIEKLLDLKEFECEMNNWIEPIPKEIMNKFFYTYGLAQLYTYDQEREFKSYNFQKQFLTNHPEKAQDLKPFGFHPEIKKEFPALVRGSEWGFFDLKS